MAAAADVCMRETILEDGKKKKLILHGLKWDEPFDLLDRSLAKAIRSDPSVAAPAFELDTHFTVVPAQKDMYWHSAKKWFPIRSIGNSHLEVQSMHLKQHQRPNIFQQCCGFDEEYVQKENLDALALASYVAEWPTKNHQFLFRFLAGMQEGADEKQAAAWRAANVSFGPNCCSTELSDNEKKYFESLTWL